jgi:hypothetical protein
LDDSAAERENYSPFATTNIEVLSPLSENCPKNPEHAADR